MSELNFYRKYRSETFQDMVGQDHIKQTLINAIQSDRVAHAYIFSGPRGTGKTSSARILAKALNCRQGPSATPCLKCDICLSIKKGNSVDVIEIDAASHTGVDHIRDLNDKVQYAPVECRYKMIIIDEVHMLSMGAFNALLKTIEEPPDHTVFVLATTEKHKIPMTIQSRCQQLLFRNLTVEQVYDHLTYIANQESITIDEASRQLLARNSSGCMRDAISLLNQVYSFKGNTIQFDDVLFILGGAPDDTLIEFVDICIQQNPQNIVQRLESIWAQGTNPTQFLTDIIRCLQDISFALFGNQALIQGLDPYVTQCVTLSKKVTAHQLASIISTLSTAEMELRTVANPAIYIQAKLLLAFMTSSTTEISTSQAPTPPAPTQVAPPPVPKAPPVFAPPVPTPSAPAQVAPPPAPKAPPVSAPPVPTPSAPTQVAPPPAPKAPPVPAPPVPTPSAPTQVAPPPAPKAPPVSAPPVSAPSVPTPVAPPPAPNISTSGSDNPLQQWDEFLTQIKQVRAGLFGILKQAQLQQVTDTHIVIKLSQDFKFFREKITDDATQETAQEISQKVFGRSLRFQLHGDGGSQSAPVAPVTEVSESASTSTQPAPTSHSDTSVGMTQESTDNQSSSDSVSEVAASPLQPDPVKESLSLNDIISMFDGDVIRQ